MQVRAWRTTYADLLPAEVLAALDADQIAEGWRLSLGRPEDARNRVLVSLERNLVTGFLVTGPATDPDCDPVATGELTDLTVDPHKRGAGHGSRLLQAGADTLVADRFTHAVMWLPAADDALRAFLTSGGLGAGRRAPHPGPDRRRHHHGQAGPPAHGPGRPELTRP